MLDWKPGDEVVCVDLDDEWAGEGPSPGILLRLGEIYTLRSIGFDRDYGWDGPGEDSGKVWVKLVEIEDDMIFSAACFEKMIDKPAATEMFERLCREEVREKEDA